MADRLTGKSAALYIFSLISLAGVWVKVGDLYEWRLEITPILYPCRIKGSQWNTKIPGPGDGRLTARRWVQTGALLANQAVGTIVNGERFDWALLAVDGGIANFDASGFSRARGTGYVARASLGAPRGGYEDEFEIALDTLPTLV